ncbi:conserved Plasmodium protein, unknown function [Plasmodium knowlesi strain H]|uniref:Uncharacterized protein n=3 Tax=Plasmodium knowlesi TaxID=5850 RepID=A0A5K1TVX9_PLAKH|nr:conserved Plasmodium protein, unknown function [Plasmodium knowlesi strain H]OTN66696.1 Uncharacterized protein PKNOH_S08488500 [Plasmodium knowlesi]CAA9986842.1 conserved Plasmodium protein, unknown function [Plasmodium knowlesi strain H]SBO23690.1 conserved Plasmodium protein, unknown function [Plasmodium knowlesi strain H]SBO25292.1 conserved Plasmodium protein, unknown function [Plasmodium knowlesi strain H]VVS76316.1 conserved Plasmodium protein, unknown function [Plasmodium knowlesi s|eukprot:XP_002260674.1 hypothetical protein, conserved in Plasmodium species [Plasmodium knowlesi strain H]
MNHRRKGKRKCKVNYIDIELEAFIFGCFFYTWNKIFTENVKQKKKENKRSNSGVSKLICRVSTGRGRGRGKSVQSLSVGKTRSTVKRKSKQLVGINKACAVKSANVLEVPTLEKDNSKRICEYNEGTLSHPSARHIGRDLNEDIQTKYKININDLNEKLLHFVKVNFCLNEKNFHIFHDLYSFYDHIREEKKDEEVNIHRVFFKTNEGGISQKGEGKSSADGNNMRGRSAVDRTRHRRGIQRLFSPDGSKLCVGDWWNPTCTLPKKCPFCELTVGKDKGVKAMKRQKFIHACTRRVYGEKNLQLVNKCIINIKTFDDSFVHSITIERLFNYVNKKNNKNLFFFWFEFLNILLKVTINKQFMIQIFFFFCIKNLLITTYFNAEQMMGSDEFSAGKTFSTKGQDKNSFLMEMLKKYKYESFSNIVLNNNYKLLQNLFDYFFMICSKRSLKFYDNFFLNVQMINFIYLVQVNFFHYYYIGLCAKFYQWESSNRGGTSKLVISTSNRGSCHTIRIPKQTQHGEDAKGKNIPFSHLKKKDGETPNPTPNLCKVKMGHKNISTLGAKVRRVIGEDRLQKSGVCIEGEQIGRMSEFTCIEEISSLQERSNTGSIFIGKHYNVGVKWPCKVNLSYYNYVQGGWRRQGSISRYVARQMAEDTPLDSNKISTLVQNEKVHFSPSVKRLARNLKIFFNRSYTFLNKYIHSDQLTKQSNIFSFLFDALPSGNLRSNVNNILEPYILSIFSRYEFIEVHDFVENLKGLYNLKKKKKTEKKKNVRINEQPNVKFLNDLQGFNYIYHNLKNDYLMLAESLYFDMRGEREKEKTHEKRSEIICQQEKQNKYGKMKISNLIQNEKTDIFKNVSIYKFSSKKLTIQHNLFNIYLECRLLNKAFKLLMVDYNFSFSFTSEVIFLYKMYLIELKRKNILFAFELLSMSFHKCFILLKKYLCNPMSFKLLSLVSLDFSNLIFNYPFLRAYLSFCPNDKIKFLRSNIILHENVTDNCYYNDYFSQRNDVDSLNLLCDDGWNTREDYVAVGGEALRRSHREALPEEISSCVREDAISAHRAWSSRAIYSPQRMQNSQNLYVDSVGRFAGRSVNRRDVSPCARDPERNQGEKDSEFFPYTQRDQYDKYLEAGTRDRRGVRSESVTLSARRPFLYDEEPFCRNAPIDLCSSVARGATSSRAGEFHRSVSHRSVSRISPSRRSNPMGDHLTLSDSSDDTSDMGENGKQHKFFSHEDHLYMRKIVHSFNFIFNILDKTVTNCEVSLLSCKEGTGRSFHPSSGDGPTGDRPTRELRIGGPTVEPSQRNTPYILAHSTYQDNFGNMTIFIKEVINKLDSYFSENFIRRNMKKHIKQLGSKKYHNFLYDSKMMRTLREAHDDTFFSSLGFLFLAYICSNYFSDHVSKSYKDSFKSFNFNNIWPSNLQIKVKILLSLIHLLLHEIKVINLNGFFLQILKIILNKFYKHLDYNDLQMFQYIYMSLSNESLFSCFSICDEIRDVIRGTFGSVKEFAYVFQLSRWKDAFSHCNLRSAEDNLGDELFVKQLLNFLLGKDADRSNMAEILNGNLLNGNPPNGNPPNGNPPNGNPLNGNPLNETALWEYTPPSECLHNETIRDESSVDAWVDHFMTHREDKQLTDHPKYQFDDFKSEASFEKNDFVFFKESEKEGRENKTKPRGRSSFLENILLHLGKKNTNGRKSPMKRVSTWNEAVQRHNSRSNSEFDRKKRGYIPLMEKKQGREKSAEEKYTRILHHFKVSKEDHIENNMNRQNEWFIRLKTWRDRYHYYENVKPDHYEAYNLEKDYYLPEELFETNCFILAEEKHQMRVRFKLNKNNYLSECLNLLRMIDLYMECRTTTCNKPLYFVKSLIITCLSVSYSRQLSVVYIHALIRLCLFELRINNFHTALCILLEILRQFEQIESYRNMLGTLFYLCGYSLLHQFNLQSERMQGEGRKRELIKEYHHYANVKREYNDSSQGCKVGMPAFLNGCNTPDISPMVRRGSHLFNHEGDDQRVVDSNKSNWRKDPIGLFAMPEVSNLDGALSERSHRSSNYTPSPLAKEKFLSDEFASSVEKRRSSLGKGSVGMTKVGSAKCAKKLIPLVKNQIKITDYFSNLKNEKMQEEPSDVDSVNSNSDIHLNSSGKKCVKKRKKNDGLTDDVVEQKEKFPTDTNFEEMKEEPYDSLEEINRKQFFLLVICFYMKRALYHWEKDGDVVGISNGIQQRKRIKDALFFLMSSYKFFYKSSLFLSKHEQIGTFKFPLFDFHLFRHYKTFYAFYRGAFLRCCNENVACSSRA